MSRSSRWRTVALVLAATVLLASCGGDGDQGATSSAVTTAPYRPASLADGRRDAVLAALDAGGAYEAAHLDEVGVSSLTFLDLVQRRWSVPGLEEAQATAVAAPEPEDASERLFVRLTDPDASRPDRAVGRDGTYWEFDVMVVALHCDQVAPPEDYAERLTREIARGDPNQRAHIAYAVQWARELQCVIPGLDDVGDELVARLTDDAGDLSRVDDEALGVSASLGYLGRADLVPPAWIDQVVAAQRDDGGWAVQEGGPDSDWHPTGLALWTLAAATGPGSDVAMVRAD